MSKQDRRNLIISLSLLVAFALWTILVSFVGDEAVGPNESKVGLAGINVFFFNLLGSNETFDKLTDLTMLFSLGVVGVFALIGIVQLFKRKSLLKVDKDIYYFALTLILLAIVYVVFEKFIVNYRPILVDGKLEASYPSSHVMLTCTVLGCAIYEVLERIKNNGLKIALSTLFSFVILFTIIGRLFSGMHWFTDIVGATLLSIDLVITFIFFSEYTKQKKQTQEVKE